MNVRKETTFFNENIKTEMLLVDGRGNWKEWRGGAHTERVSKMGMDNKRKGKLGKNGGGIGMHLQDLGEERRSGSGSEDGGIGATTEKRDQESWRRRETERERERARLF